MPAELLEFPQRTVSGPARCTSCKHEWVAVAPFDERLEALECPGCGLNKGLYVNHFAPIGETVWQCSCGCQLFYVVQLGERLAAYCVNCGDSTEF